MADHNDVSDVRSFLGSYMEISEKLVIHDLTKHLTNTNFKVIKACGRFAALTHDWQRRHQKKLKEVKDWNFSLTPRLFKPNKRTVESGPMSSVLWPKHPNL